VVDRADKFENSYIEVRGWWFSVSDILVLACDFVLYAANSRYYLLTPVIVYVDD